MEKQNHKLFRYIEKYSFAPKTMNTNLNEEFDTMKTAYATPFEAARFAESFLRDKPNYSECAYVAKRPLSFLPVMISSRNSGLLDRENLEIAHEHIIFPNSGDNIGWGNEGLFSESLSKHDYTHDDVCHNGETMRRAIATLSLQNRFDDKNHYHALWNNCQDFISAIRQRLGGMQRA